MTNYGFISFNKETPKCSAQLWQKTIIIKSPTKCLQLEHSLLIALINLAHRAAGGAGAGRSGSGEFSRPAAAQRTGANGIMEQSSLKHPAATQDPPSPQSAMAAPSPRRINIKLGGWVRWILMLIVAR